MGNEIELWWSATACCKVEQNPALRSITRTSSSRIERHPCGALVPCRTGFAPL
jgi:hypothetical protein